MKNLFYLLVTSLLLLISLPDALAAEKYPSRPIQLINGSPPGGYITLATQLITPNLRKNLGVPIIVNYKTGGVGAVGVTYLAKSKPDGYSIGIYGTPHTVLLPAVIPDVHFKPSDLDPLCKFFSSPFGVFCRGNSPWKSMADVVADAKKRPGQITFAAGPKSLSHLLMVSFLEAAGIKMLFVPTQAAGQTITRLIGGNIDLGVVALAPIVGQIKAGAARGLFLTSSQRASATPEIPTLMELGFNAPVLDSYTGFYAPVGMPKPVRDILGKALEKSIKDSSLKKKLEEQALILDYQPSEVLAKDIKNDYERIIKLVKITGDSK